MRPRFGRSHIRGAGIASPNRPRGCQTFLPSISGSCRNIPSAIPGILHPKVRASAWCVPGKPFSTRRSQMGYVFPVVRSVLSCWQTIRRFYDRIVYRSDISGYSVPRRNRYFPRFRRQNRFRWSVWLILVARWYDRTHVARCWGAACSVAPCFCGNGSSRIALLPSVPVVPVWLSWRSCLLLHPHHSRGDPRLWYCGRILPGIPWI